MSEKLIRGYGQEGGGALVTIDGAPLGLPEINPRHEARHSPDGFQWGYGGSGPSELARALLIALCPSDERLARHPGCYQRFKFAVIARLPKDFTLSGEVVERWMADFKATTAGSALDADLEAVAAIDRTITGLDAEELRSIARDLSGDEDDE